MIMGCPTVIERRHEAPWPEQYRARGHEPSCIFKDHRPGIHPDLLRARRRAWRKQLIRIRAEMLALGLIAKTRRCTDCGADISHRHGSAKRCEACAAGAKLERTRAYGKRRTAMRRRMA